MLFECICEDTKSKLRSNTFAHSPIWNEMLIDELNRSKQSTFEINRERSKYLTPKHNFETKSKTLVESIVPIVLIQSTTTNTFDKIKNGALGNGWDLIVPREWGMAFWMTLVYHGAKPIGLNELAYLNFESGIQNWFFGSS
jgi:ribonuclease P/MRP protein subunit POP1